MRDEVFEKQRALGVVPESTRLVPRNPGVHAWEETDENKRLFAARLQEAFAAQLDHGRARRNVERLGEQGEIRDRTACELAAMNAAPGERVSQKIPTLLDLLDVRAASAVGGFERESGVLTERVNDFASQ